MREFFARDEGSNSRDPVCQQAPLRTTIRLVIAGGNSSPAFRRKAPIEMLG